LWVSKQGVGKRFTETGELEKAKLYQDTSRRKENGRLLDKGA
jgi:hypothetical protein